MLVPVLRSYTEKSVAPLDCSTTFKTQVSDLLLRRLDWKFNSRIIFLITILVRSFYFSCNIFLHSNSKLFNGLKLFKKILPDWTQLTEVWLWSGHIGKKNYLGWWLDHRDDRCTVMRSGDWATGDEMKSSTIRHLLLIIQSGYWLLCLWHL